MLRRATWSAIAAATRFKTTRDWLSMAIARESDLMVFASTGWSQVLGTAGNSLRCRSWTTTLLIAGSLLAPGPASGQTASAQPAGVEVTNHSSTTGHDFSRWEKEVAAYEAADQKTPPPQGGILFIGSSTIRLWKTLASDFPGLPVINRGFGGTEIVDSTHFADRLIFPHRPKQIFLRAGGNDIHDGRLPDEVAADFLQFVNAVHSRLPKTEIYFIAVSPAPSRWGENDKYQALNKRIRELAVNLPRVGFIDAYAISLTATGQARPELFVADRLHFNPEGYKLLTEAVRPYLPAPK